MNEIIIHCPNCYKPLIKGAILPVGTFFKCGCYHCNAIIKVYAGRNGLQRAVDSLPQKDL